MLNEFAWAMVGVVIGWGAQRILDKVNLTLFLKSTLLKVEEIQSYLVKYFKKV